MEESLRVLTIMAFLAHGSAGTVTEERQLYPQDPSAESGDPLAAVGL
jgi:hypothetical protein